MQIVIKMWQFLTAFSKRMAYSGIIIGEMRDEW